MIEKLDVGFSNDYIYADDIESQTITFFSEGLAPNTIDLNNINLDHDNFDEDDPETITHVS